MKHLTWAALAVSAATIPAVHAQTAPLLPLPAQMTSAMRTVTSPLSDPYSTVETLQLEKAK